MLFQALGKAMPPNPPHARPPTPALSRLVQTGRDMGMGGGAGGGRGWCRAPLVGTAQSSSLELGREEADEEGLQGGWEVLLQ